MFLIHIFTMLYCMYDDGLYDSAYDFNLLFKRNISKNYILTHIFASLYCMSANGLYDNAYDFNLLVKRNTLRKLTLIHIFATLYYMYGSAVNGLYPLILNW